MLAFTRYSFFLSTSPNSSWFLLGSPISFIDLSIVHALASESRGRRRLQFTSAPLEGKTFFLHVQSASKARELERKLKELGGVSTEI